MKLEHYIQQTAAVFDEADLCYGHGTDNAWDEAVYLCFGFLDIPFSADKALARELNREESARLNALVKQRIEEKTPVAYLLGKAWFCGVQFHCDTRALIPRSPFAELISNGFEPMLKSTPAKILDMCCGGGCIGIACALEFDEAGVDLADISEPALALAQENIDLHKLSVRVNTRRSDLFSDLHNRYDLIVCNPPYVGTDEFMSLAVEYRHEPGAGLYCADQGLAIPLQILSQAADYLSDQGLLFMEVGNSAQALARRLVDVPLLWLDFEHGGSGVFCLSASQLQQYRECFT